MGASGGTLAAAGGAFTMTVPAGTLSGAATLAVTESAAPPPSGLPNGMAAASKAFTLTGAVLSQPEPATFKYEPSSLGGGSPARLSVYEESAPSAWAFIPTGVAAAAGSVTADIPGPGTFAVLADTRHFSDVPAGYWARSDIDALLAAGVISGFGNGTFQPDGALTRAQFVKMLVLTLRLPPGSGVTAFSDVPASAWFAPYVSAAVQAGLVQGLSATSFGPNDPVTREQMAVLLARALRLTGNAALTFTDAGTIGAWALAGVRAAVASGYINGLPSGAFAPTQTTTRAQAAKVLALAIARQAPSGS